MAGLLGDLVSAAHSLAAQQAGVEVASRNLSNVNTPGYSRERVVLGDRAVVQTANGWQGTGVEALGVEQIRDTLLDAQVTREASQTQYLTSQQSAYNQAQSALGEQVDTSSSSAAIGDSTGTTTGIAASLNDFFNAFDNLASNPTDQGSKQVLLQQADTLASKFNVADQRLSSLQSDLTTQIGSDVSSANDLLKGIASLNVQIQNIEVSAPGSALALRDQRQQKLEQLAQYMNFTTTTVPNGNGAIQVSASDANGASVLLVDKGNVLGSVGFNGTQFTGGSAGTALALTGGSLPGNLSARDGMVQTLRNNLQTTATQFATAVNKAYNPTSNTGNFFTVPPTTGIIQTDPTLTATTLKTTDTGTSGGNELALAVANVATQKFSTANGDAINGTLSSYYGGVVSGVGQTIAGVNTQLSDQTLVQTMISQQRDSVSGVSMDEEVSDLMKFQRAYQASSRVVSVIDTMLQSLISMGT
jgi:flagellar hook-associated protein 1 FlgK